MDITERTLKEAAGLLRDGQLSPTDYAAALLEQTLAHSDLNPYCHYDPERLQQLVASAKPGASARLPGVLIGIKDNINTADWPTTAGTPALQNHHPSENASVVQALLDEGAVISGKLNMHELAFGITTNNAFYGPSRNPYNPAHIAGGSSGGNAVAIAARMIPAALGTDTGGSTRVPAAFCGISGFRPTIDRYDQQGVVPISHTRDSVGPMARTVEDIIYLDGILSGGHTEPDPVDLASVRLGVPLKPFYQNLHPDIQASADKLLATLENLGAQLITLDMSDISELNQIITGPVCFYEILQDLPFYLKQSKAACSLEAVIEQIASPDVQEVFQALLGPAKVSQQDYYQIIARDRYALQFAYRRHFEIHNLDAIVFPTVQLPAPPIGDDDTTLHNNETVPTFPTVVRNTDPAGNAGVPGVSIPVGLTEQGLPIGFEFDSMPGYDRKLLSIAHCIQSAIPVMPPPPGIVA